VLYGVGVNPYPMLVIKRRGVAVAKMHNHYSLRSATLRNFRMDKICVFT